MSLSAGTKIGPYEILSPLGKHFLVCEFAGQAPDDRMTVTLNWFGELRAGAGAAAGGPR